MSVEVLKLASKTDQICKPKYSKTHFLAKPRKASGSTRGSCPLTVQGWVGEGSPRGQQGNVWGGGGGGGGWWETPFTGGAWDAGGGGGGGAGGGGGEGGGAAEALRWVEMKQKTKSLVPHPPENPPKSKKGVDGSAQLGVGGLGVESKVNNRELN